MEESAKRIAPFGLRLPPDLKERVQEAAAQSNQSMNALIQGVLEREFPQPTINLHELGAFLAALASEADEHGPEAEYLEMVNQGLAGAKYPWTVEYDGLGVLKFYPFPTRPKKEREDSARRFAEKRAELSKEP